MEEDTKVFNDVKIKEMIQASLKKKYNEDFVVISVSNLFEGDNFDTVKACCKKENDRNNIFFVKTHIYDTDNIIEDDYYIRDVTSQIDNYIQHNFTNYHINGFSRTEIIGKNQLNSKYDVEGFFVNFPQIHFLCIAVIDGKNNQSIVYEILKNIKNVYPHININFLIYEIEDNYLKLYKELMDKTNISCSLIEITSKYQKSNLQIVNGEVI